MDTVASSKSSRALRGPGAGVVARGGAARTSSRGILSFFTDASSGHQFEPLEPRALLAAVAWTGQGGDNLWSNPANWSNTVVPAAGDDVAINVPEANPTIRFTAEAGSVRLESLDSSEAITFTGGELLVASRARIGALVAVMGGTIGGGSWESLAGNITFAGAAPSRIVGPVTFLTPIATINTQVRVEGDFDTRRTVTVNGGGMDFASNIELDSGTFVMINSRIGLAAAGESQRTMTIGAGAVVRGYGSIGGALFSERLVTTLINRGTIVADVSARYLVIAPVGAFASAMDNQGIIRATGGGIARIAATNLTNYSEEGSGTLTGGTWRAEAQSTLLIDYSRTVTVNAANIVLVGTNASFSNMMEWLRTNNGSLTLGPGMQWTRYFGLSNNGTITLESISAMSLPVAGTHAGTFVIHAGSILSTTAYATFLPGAQVIGSGTLQLTSGPTHLRQIFGTDSSIRLIVSRNATVTLDENIRLGSIENSGTVNMGGWRATLSGSFTQLSTGIIHFDLRNATSAGCIDAAGSIAMGGTLHAQSSTDFDPSKQGAVMFTAVLFRGSSISGSFSTVTQISAVSGAMQWMNTGHSFELWHNVADFNADGGVDGGDLEAFLIDWEAGRVPTDINGDGGVDGGDLEAFLTLWAIGGR